MSQDRSLLLGRQTSKWSFWDAVFHGNNSTYNVQKCKKNKVSQIAQKCKKIILDDKNVFPKFLSLVRSEAFSLKNICLGHPVYMVSQAKSGKFKIFHNPAIKCSIFTIF